MLDISAAALDRARTRVGGGAASVTWIAADVTAADWVCPRMDVWHDRAVFHFLTAPDDRRRYIERMQRTVKRGGHAVMGTFADPGGPQKCSGLDVRRYSAASLSDELGSSFELRESLLEDHQTPSGTVQRFQWCLFRRI